MRFTSLQAVAIATAALAIASCGSDDAAEPTNDDAPAETTLTSNAENDDAGGAESGDDPYTIGLIVEETGNAAVFKDSIVEGYQTALSRLENSSSRQFEVVTCDGGSVPDMALACYERLVKRDGVDALVGPTVSASALAITPAVSEDNIINYFLGGGYGGRTMEGNHTQFGANATNTDVLAAIWSWAEKEGMKDVYMISTADATGQACRDFFEKDEFEEARSGLEILGQDEMAIDAQSAAPQMSKVPTDADLVVLCATGGAGVVMATSFAQSGLEMPAMKLHSQALPLIEGALVGAVPDDQIYVAGFCPMAAAKGELAEGFLCSASTLEFTALLKEQFPDAVPTFLSAATYDAVVQIGTAVGEVGKDADDIVGWFESQTGLPGANGVYDFGPDQHRGMGPDSVIIGVYRGDGFYLASMNDMPTL